MAFGERKALSPEQVKERQARAKTTAYRVAEANGIDPDTVRHMHDTVIGKSCFVVTETDDDHVLVVYDDDPDTRFMIMKAADRLRPLEKTA